MKRHIFFALALMAMGSLNAQEPTQFTQKLDSVVGSNDFDWSRWKKAFEYYDFSSGPQIVSNTYQWEASGWNLSEQSVRCYDSINPLQLTRVVVLDYGENGVNRSRSDYEYDLSNRLTLIMNFVPDDTVWTENSKYEYIYNTEGLLDSCIYSTIRNGSWRATELTLYSYDENQQCTDLRVQRKGGWGPGANQWRDSYRYEFEYENGSLAREMYYTPVGWFGTEMNLDSKWEYEFDVNGNLLRKTGSVYNGEDWIVRDVLENRYDLTVDASTVKGLEPFWLSMGNAGFNYATGAAVPLANLWTSCSIISTDLDTEFTLYCSGFEGVEEEQTVSLKAYANGGRLMVLNDQPADVMVYDLLGRVVASERQTQQCEFDLHPGLYVVACGNARVKVIVK